MEALELTLSLPDIEPVIQKLRSEMANLLREQAEREDDLDVESRLREIADTFEGEADAGND